MDAIYVDGLPLCKLHGLRMLSPAITQCVPFSSADSTSAILNGGKYENARIKIYSNASPGVRIALVMSHIENAPVCHTWAGPPVQTDKGQRSLFDLEVKP